MKILKNIFRRKEKQEPQPLRIEGVGEAPLTAEPDDAELAAAALLETMAEVQCSGFKVHGQKEKKHESLTDNHKPIRDANYYKELASRIRQAHDAARLRTMRFVAFCEQELKKADLPLEGTGSLGLLNAELMKRIDTIERVGGELKKRWQHCLAEVTVRLMQATAHTDSTDNDTNTKNNDIDNRTDHESP